MGPRPPGEIPATNLSFASFITTLSSMTALYLLEILLIGEHQGLTHNRPKIRKHDLWSPENRPKLLVGRSNSITSLDPAEIL